MDIAARFSDRNTILYAWTDNQNDVRHPYLLKHLKKLKAATRENGNPIQLIPMELPEGSIRAIGDRYDPALGSGNDLTDASYLNYLVTNDLVLISNNWSEIIKHLNTD